MLDQPTVWHQGERALQTKAGVEDRIEAMGKKIVRAYMPQQHRDFFEMLEEVHLGAVDTTGHPVALTRVGPSGFMTSPDDKTLVIRSKPLPGEPNRVRFDVGSKISVVGVQYETQRRNRLNATVKAVRDDAVYLQVDQSFGNCPKYIQVRERAVDGAATRAKTLYLPALDDASAAQIRRADSLFIASRSGSFSDDPRTGVDINHRGGMPGFVGVLDAYTIEFPDYKGNNFFNTLGNIVQDGRVNVQFTEFETGALLNIRGHAALHDLPDYQEGYTGHLVRIHVEGVSRTEAAFPHRYNLVSFSDRNPQI